MPKLTIAGFLACKGQRRITQTFTMKEAEARACNEAGIDVIVTMADRVPALRAVAPDVLLVGAGDFTELAASDESAIRCGIDILGKGADAVYVGAHDLRRVEAMANAAIPVIGHVGLVPYRNTWVGGMRAVGKTVDEALTIHRRTQGYESAGAIAVEMEVVPQRLAAEIARRTRMIVVGMGAGAGCDGEYLFAEDMFGTNSGHVPRHAKQYCDLKPEYDRIHRMMVDAITAFRADVDSGAYPEEGHVVMDRDGVLDEFLTRIEA